MNTYTLAVAGGAAPSPALVNQEVLDQAFAALKNYDYGSSRAALMPIDDAVRACAGNAAAKKVLERQLAGVLSAKVSVVAREYVCGKLGLIGSEESMPVLAELLADKNLSHPARAALEAISGPKAATLFRDSLPKLDGLLKAGVIDSIGRLRDGQSVKVLAELLESANNSIAGAAAAALGNIGTPRAARALRTFLPKASLAVRQAMADACLACAEHLLNNGDQARALATYKSLVAASPSKHVQWAAQRGIQLAEKK